MREKIRTHQLGDSVVAVCICGMFCMPNCYGLRSGTCLHVLRVGKFVIELETRD